MATLSIKVSSGNLESYEALFLQFPDPGKSEPVELLELNFGDVTQVFPSAYCLLAAYLGRVSDPSRRLLVSRRFGANPSSAKLERAMDAIGFVSAVGSGKAPEGKTAPGIIPLIPISKDTPPDSIASRVIDALVATTQPTRDAKENLFVVVAELVDNVVRHSGVEGAGYLCGTLTAQKRKLELCIADAGVGIRKSLEHGEDKDARRRVQRGQSALRLALEPGRTSKGPGNTGFGLFLAREATSVTRGTIRITSGEETLIYSREGERHRDHACWHGTVVNLQWSLDKPGPPADVYRRLPFPLGPEGSLVTVADTVQRPEVLVSLKGSGPYLGSLPEAASTRERLLEGVRQGRLAVVDLDGVLAMTAGYVDCLFGELVDVLGAGTFRESVAIRNAGEFAKLLAEAVVERRVEATAAAAEPSKAAEEPPEEGPTEQAPEPETPEAPPEAAGGSAQEP